MGIYVKKVFDFHSFSFLVFNYDFVILQILQLQTQKLITS